MLNETIINFFQMGGYAAYVWPAYAIVIIVMVIQIVVARQQSKF